jgi:hypothetical protein
LYDEHWAHVSVVVLQTGVLPVHSVELLAEHWAQAPVERQAGNVAMVHGRLWLLP